MKLALQEEWGKTWEWYIFEKILVTERLTLKYYNQKKDQDCIYHQIHSNCTGRHTVTAKRKQLKKKWKRGGREKREKGEYKIWILGIHRCTLSIDMSKYTNVRNVHSSIMWHSHLETTQRSTKRKQKNCSSNRYGILTIMKTELLHARWMKLRNGKETTQKQM